MPDPTRRSKEALLTIFQNNTTGNISPRDIRDFVESVYPEEPYNAYEFIDHSNVSGDYTIQLNYDLNHNLQIVGNANLIFREGKEGRAYKLFINPDEYTITLDNATWLSDIEGEFIPAENNILVVVCTGTETYIAYVENSATSQDYSFVTHDEVKDAYELILSDNLNHELNITGDTILSFEGAMEGRVYRIIINAATYTISFQNMKWVNGEVGVPTENGKDLLILFYTGSEFIARMENNYEDAPIAILNIEYPNGGNILFVNDHCNITWSAIDIGNIQILYSINDGSSYIEIIGSVDASLGTYSWTIPLGAVSTQCLIKIVGVEFPTFYDVSDDVFEVREALLDVWVQVAPQLNDQTAIQSTIEFNNKLYGGTYPDGLLFEWNGSNAWIQKAAQLNSQTAILSLCKLDSKLYGGTYPGGRLFEWDNSSLWVQKAGQLNSQTSINCMIKFNNELYAGTSPGGRLFKWNNIDAWTQVADKLEEQCHIFGFVLWDNRLYAVTGSNGMLFRWNNYDSWIKICDQLNSQADIFSPIVFNSKIYAGTSPGGRLFE